MCSTLGKSNQNSILKDADQAQLVSQVTCKNCLNEGIDGQESSILDQVGESYGEWSLNGVKDKKSEMIKNWYQKNIRNDQKHIIIGIKQNYPQKPMPSSTIECTTFSIV